MSTFNLDPLRDDGQNLIGLMELLQLLNNVTVLGAWWKESGHELGIGHVYLWLR